MSVPSPRVPTSEESHDCVKSSFRTQLMIVEIQVRITGFARDLPIRRHLTETGPGNTDRLSPEALLAPPLAYQIIEPCLFALSPLLMVHVVGEPLDAG